VGNYLFWHFVFAPQAIIVVVANYIVFLTHFFSVKTLITFLGAPWKREVLERRKPGWNLQEMVNVVVFNLISRTIGLIIRFWVLVTWVVVEIMFVVVGLGFLGLWLVLPGVTIPVYLLLRERPNSGKEILKKAHGNPQIILKILMQTAMVEFVLQRLSIKKDDLGKLLVNAPGGTNVTIEGETSEQILVSLVKNWAPLKKYLFDLQIDPKDVESCCNWWQRLQEREIKEKKFWKLENLKQNPGIGKDWIYGYTPALNQFTTDLALSEVAGHHLVGRKNTVAQIERIIERSNGSNVMLVGAPGVGKQTIILNLAHKIQTGQVPVALAYKRVLALNLNQILATSASLMEAKGKLEELFNEAERAGNVILVIYGIDNYVSGLDNRVNLSEVFGKVMERGRIRIIGTTTPGYFEKYLRSNQELMKNFEKVEAVAPTKEEGLIILEDAIVDYERKTKTWVQYQALKEALDKAEEYIINIPFPEKALDILDEACVYVANQKTDHTVTPKEIDLILSQKTKIPLGQVEAEEVEKLKKLEELLHKRIVSQDQAVIVIAKAMRRARLEISEKQKTIGSFLFLGPTGVGKTETAKTLAEAYFGNQERLIRFDMSEYQGEIGMAKALGDPQKEEPGLMVKAIRENPFSVLLLDEIEKTDPKILNLFLVMMDEGYVTDNFGEKIDCRHLIIIGTSNAGSEFIREEVESGVRDQVLGERVIKYVQEEKIFSPEFINRFDGVVVFKPLSPADLRAIAKLMLIGLNKRLAEKDIAVKITDDLIAKIAQKGYQPSFGARPMKRVIQDEVEDQVAKRILEGSVKRGEEIEIEI